MAAFNMPVTFRQKNLTCDVCQEIYRSPSLLPCHHSFCLQCIEGLASSNGRVFPCPVCRKPTQVPTGGVRVFQSNFYITEEELQLARNNTESALCPTHTTEPVIFLCKECDQAICIRCKLLKHNLHDCEDLSEAARRCKTQLTEGERRLQGTIGHLTKQLHLAEDNVKSAQEKRVALKEQVKSQRDMLIARVNKWHDEAIKNVDNVADTVEEQLQAEVRHVQHELDSLTPLTQRVHHALGDACDADVVSCEKEMRIGMGSKDELVRLESEAQITIVRPGLHCDIGSVTDDDIKRAIGAAVTLTTPHLGPTETITKVFCCVKDGKCREVHALCPLDTGDTLVSCGGMPPDFKEERQISFNENGETKQEDTLLNGRVSFKRYGQRSGNFRSTYSFDGGKRLNSKSATMFQLLHYSGLRSCTVYTTAVKSRDPFHIKRELLFTLNASNPLSFDVSSNGTIFVVLHEGEALVETKYSQYSTSGTSLPKSKKTKMGKNREEAMDTCHSQSDQTEHAYSRSSARCGATRRKVLLYRPYSREPICVYTPPESTFFPSDVSFWTVRGEEKLLVADWMNDAVHVVRFDAGECHFERYLAAGHGDLVKPSALDTDSQGRLWIGCSNGWVMRCEELEEEEDSMLDITASDDLDSTEAEVGLEPDFDSDQE